MNKIANYLITHYKGKYRVKTFYDINKNQFPRENNGSFSENDIFIDCLNNIKIFHYGNKILQAYIPSIGRGHNIVKAIREELGDEVISNIEETDSEVLFKFNVNYMEKFEKYLKPKTGGANISPFSSKNLPKNKEYTISEEEVSRYKNIIKEIGHSRIIELSHLTNTYLKTLVNKKNSWENIKLDMAQKGLTGKNYIHAIGKWDEYISYLRKELNL